MRKAAGEADTRWKNYQNYLKSIAKPNVREVTIQRGKSDTENALTNFLGAWSKKLTPIFAKAGMKVVSLAMANIRFHVCIRLNKDYLHQNLEDPFTLDFAEKQYIMVIRLFSMCFCRKPINHKEKSHIISHQHLPLGAQKRHNLNLNFYLSM